MAETETNNVPAKAESKRNRSGITIIAVAVVMGILAVAGYFIYQEYQDSLDAEKEAEKVEEEIEDLQDEVAELEDELEAEMEDDISQELQDELDTTLAFIRVIRVDISSEFLDDLKTVEDFITDNPRILIDDSIEIPADVQDAYDRVKSAYEGAVGTSETPVDDDEEVLVGNRYNVMGVIEVSEYSDNTIGTVYEVTDEELDVTLYFQFSESISEDVNENMLGEEVELEVEITEVTDSGVTYKVVSGPDLVE